MNTRELIAILSLMATLIFCVERSHSYLLKKQETIVAVEKIKLEAIKEEKELAAIELQMFK
jgi:hypothetical protein